MREIEMDETSLIISETDARGVITFANDDFLRYSGYGWEELLGKPHNILRHPDMPKAAFKDLWDTIKKGATWNGFVKNRTKHGEYYWVYATVSPITFENGETRYLSLRRKPTRQEIAKYDALYKTMH
ncbi:PAS domain S-box protein [Sulfuricurvum sp. IAE1]|uniref:PAS domain-containing protein n=1 Tax=Sulfuricurvum sp. IAE1 TaxID=2546102 RepID=UPI0010516FE8|nr:PAS domain-containing protein [Sulfuricurvum sp. IAE1]TDA63209.1 PAS domain S-box protein [Sulfuricurvum sp. IAE1]